MQSRSKSLIAAAGLLLATPAVADSPLHFAYRDGKGNVHDVHFDGKAWQRLQLNNGGMTTAPAALGDPSAFSAGGFSAFSFSHPTLPADHRDFTYLGENGDIHHVFLQHGKWGREILNNAGVTNAPPAAGPVAALLLQHWRLAYTYRDKDGNLQHIATQDGSWQAIRLNNGGSTPAPPAAGDPAALESESGHLEVLYRDAAGGLQHLLQAGGKWQAEQLNLGAATEAPAGAGEPVPLSAGAHQFHCLYRDISGNLQHLARSQDKWSHEQVNNGGATTAPLAAGAPSASLGAGGQLDFVYRDPEGGLNHLFLKEAKWGSEKLNGGGLSSAPPAAGDPWIRWAPGSKGGSIHVFYLDGQGNLQQLSCHQGKWTGEAVNTGAHVTMALPAGRLSFY